MDKWHHCLALMRQSIADSCVMSCPASLANALCRIAITVVHKCHVDSLRSMHQKHRTDTWVVVQGDMTGSELLDTFTEDELPV